MLNKRHVLNSECVFNRKGLDIEGGAIECVRAFHVLKVSRSWMSTLWKTSFEDITSIRALGILYWERSSYLGERKAIVTTDMLGDIAGHVPRELSHA